MQYISTSLVYSHPAKFQISEQEIKAATKYKRI